MPLGGGISMKDASELGADLNEKQEDDRVISSYICKPPSISYAGAKFCGASFPVVF